MKPALNSLLFVTLLLSIFVITVTAGPRFRRQANDVGVNVGSIFNMGLTRRGGWRDLGLDVLSGLVRVNVNRDPLAGRAVLVDVGGQPVFG